MSWRKFEYHARRYLRRRFPEHAGWLIEEQAHRKHHPVAYARRPDFLLMRTKFGTKEAIVADAKYVKVLRINHLEQLLDYTEVISKTMPGYVFYCPIMLIGPRHHTYVSREVKEYAEENGIEITRLIFRG